MFFVHSSGMFFLLLSLSLFICDNAWHPPNHRPRRQQSPLAASSGQSWHQPIQQHCLPLLHSSWPSASPRSSPHPAILETDFAIKAELFELWPSTRNGSGATSSRTLRMLCTVQRNKY